MNNKQHIEKLREEWKSWLYKKDDKGKTFRLPNADDVADWWVDKLSEVTKEALTCQSCKLENYGMTVCSHCIPNPSFSQEYVDKAIREAWIDGFMSSGEGYNGEYFGHSKHKITRENVGKAYDEKYKDSITNPKQ